MSNFKIRELEILKFLITKERVETETHLERIRTLYGSETKAETLDVYGKYVLQLIQLDDKIDWLMNKK